MSNECSKERYTDEIAIGRPVEAASGAVKTMEARTSSKKHRKISKPKVDDIMKTGFKEQESEGHGKDGRCLFSKVDAEKLKKRHFFKYSVIYTLATLGSKEWPTCGVSGHDPPATTYGFYGPSGDCTQCVIYL